MSTAETAYVWAAADFADEEVKNEKFAARFKTKELVRFKILFNIIKNQFF